jgi:aerobic carbon-monoxide dehydrogenase medium subunit
MQSFEYHRPASLEEAQMLLAGSAGARVLAGGQSLIPAMKIDLATPAALVSLRGLAELRGIRADGQSVDIGAMTTHAEVAASPDVRTAIPALAAMADQIGDPQVRNRGTIGGSIAHADPAADYPAAVLGLGATVVTHKREIPADDCFRGMLTTALEPSELIVSVRFPIPERAAYMKFASPASKFAIVGVLVARGGGGVRVAVTGAGRAVFRQRAMEDALSARFEPDALRGIDQSPDGLLSDLEASAEYRAHLVGVMARRAVAACA